MNRLRFRVEASRLLAHGHERRHARAIDWHMVRTESSRHESTPTGTPEKAGGGRSVVSVRSTVVTPGVTARRGCVSDGVASDKAAVLPFYCTCYTVQYGTVLYSTMGKVLYCTVLYCKGKQDHEHLELPQRSVQRGGSLDTKGSRGHVTIYTIPRTNQEPLGNRLLRR